jgi:hypothetical protein
MPLVKTMSTGQKSWFFRVLGPFLLGIIQNGTILDDFRGLAKGG